MYLESILHTIIMLVWLLYTNTFAFTKLGKLSLREATELLCIKQKVADSRFPVSLSLLPYAWSRWSLSTSAASVTGLWSCILASQTCCHSAWCFQGVMKDNSGCAQPPWDGNLLRAANRSWASPRTLKEGLYILCTQIWLIKKGGREREGAFPWSFFPAHHTGWILMGPLGVKCCLLVVPCPPTSGGCSPRMLTLLVPWLMATGTGTVIQQRRLMVFIDSVDKRHISWKNTGD